jgi:hypothetical protein
VSGKGGEVYAQLPSTTWPVAISQVGETVNPPRSPSTSHKPPTYGLWLRAGCAVVPFLAIVMIATTAPNSGPRSSTTSPTSKTVRPTPRAPLPASAQKTHFVVANSVRSVIGDLQQPTTAPTTAPNPGTSRDSSIENETKPSGVSAWQADHAQLLSQLHDDAVTVGADTANGETSSLPGDCDQLGADVHVAQSISPAPDPLAASLWTQALGELARATDECTNGVDAHDESAIAATATTASSAGSTLAALTETVAAPASSVTQTTDAGTSCLGDETAAFEGYADALSNNTLPFPHQCMAIDGTIDLTDVSNETINGNGAALLVSDRTGFSPVFQLVDDTNVTIENFTIVGSYDGTNSDEGAYGVVFEADAGVTLTHDTFRNIQGDFLYLSPPYDSHQSDALNTDITVSESRFDNGGYHGLSVESVNGLNVNRNVFDGINVDAMDFEYDDYSTGFTGCPSDDPSCADPTGEPFWAAQDNIEIEDNSWYDWNGSDWLASIQGQTPGVQAQNWTISGNELYDDAPLFEVVATNPALTAPAYTADNWTIANNHYAPGYYAKAYRGGTSVAAQLYFIGNLTLTRNTFPLCAGQFEEPQPQSACSTPDEYVFDLATISTGTMEYNDFGGAIGIVLPQLYDQYLTDFTECGNSYWDSASQPVTDATCGDTS